MKRRPALFVLAWGLGGTTVLPTARAERAVGRDAAIAWGADGCFVTTGGEALHRLPDLPAAGIAPVPTALGVWLVTSAGVLRRWQADASARWELQCSVRFDAPVHALAASPDGQWALAAHGERLSLLDPHGEAAARFDGVDATRGVRGAATALFSLPQRRSFFAAWPVLGESWEISIDPAAAPIFDGLVHDYRMGEGIAKPGYLGARRAPLGRPLPDFSFADARVPWLAGTLGDEVSVVHLDVRRGIAALRASGANPSGAALRMPSAGGVPLEWWLPAGHEVHIFDTARWLRLAVHALPAPVRQLQVVHDTVWALVGPPGGGLAHLLRDGPAAEWQRVSKLAAPLAALRSEPGGSRLLALQAHPPALRVVDGGDGALLRHWPLPPQTAPQGAAWLPPA